MKKKILAAILAFALAFTCCAPAFAEGETAAPAADYDGVPFVLVRGMEFGGLIYKQGTDEERNCLGEIKAGELIKALSKGIASGVFHRDFDRFTDVIIDYVEGIMGLMACDEKGNSKYDVTVPNYPLSIANYPELENPGDENELGILKAASERYGAENVYYYRYDWRLDPFAHADAINNLINQALEDSGKSKVNLVCCSMGGIETLSYIYKYGAEKLNRVMFMSSTFYGTHVTTDVLRGMIEIDPFNLYTFAYQNVGGGNRAVKFLFDVLYKTKVFDGVCRLANDTLIPKLKDKVYADFLKPVFGTMPSVWALVLEDGYDEAIEYMFGGEEEKYADFIALTEEYQVLASKKEEVLKEAEAGGVSICVVSSYNSACIPVYPGGGCNGDAVLEADRMLGGAVVAKLGSTLGDDYAAADPARLSPDKVVDLSPVIFPKTTWAISGSPHVACSYGSDYNEFLFWAVDFDGDISVNSSEKYPQFMLSSKNQELRIP